MTFTALRDPQALADLVARFDGRAPRYTSYPTAVQFTPEVGEAVYRRWLADLPGPDGIGAEAGRRAVEKLGPRKIASTTAPVIFDRRVATQLLSPLLGAISGPSIARGTSFLKDEMGQVVLPRGVGSPDQTTPAGATAP